MQWSDKAPSRLLGLPDWSTSGHLAHVDPYLTWLDVAGAPLPEGVRWPCIERLGGSEAAYRTRWRATGDLKQMVRDVSQGGRGDVLRYEICADLRADLDAPAPLQAAMAAGDGSPQRRSRKSTVIGFIDFGLAFAHRQFHEPGRRDSRVLAIWDQSPRAQPAPWPPPAGCAPLHWQRPPGFAYGFEAHRGIGGPAAASLSAYLRQFQHAAWTDEEGCYRYSGYPSLAGHAVTHGTFIADVATGHPDPLRHPGLQGRHRLPALQTRLAIPAPAQHDADIVFVNLPPAHPGRPLGGPLRTHVLDGLRYIADLAADGARLVVNISYGGHAGPHDGSSILEQAIDDFVVRARQQRGFAQFDVVLASGNARGSRLHAQARVKPGETARFEWNNLPEDPTDSFAELWMSRSQDVSVRVTPPGGAPCPAVRAGGLRTLAQGPGTVAAVVYPHRACQSDRPDAAMILLAVGPTARAAVPGRPSRAAAPYGRWVLEVANEGPDELRVDGWCEFDRPPFGSIASPRQSRFNDTASTRVDTDLTLNSMAHGRETWIVGACTQDGRAVAPYSSTGPGRGCAGRDRHPRAPGAQPALRGPDAVRPGDEGAALPGLPAAAVFSGETARLSGTSVAAAVLARERLDQPRAPRPARDNTWGHAGRPRGPGHHPDTDLLAQAAAAPARPRRARGTP